MDGTLWNAVSTYVLAWNKYYQQLGIDKVMTYQELGPQMGVEEKALLKLTLPHISEEKRSTEYNDMVVPLVYISILEVGGEFYEGVLEGLKDLAKKYKLFIVSNCPANVIDCFVKYAGIKDVITNSVAHGQNFKPKSENINLLIHRHKLKNSVYVGDTDSDSLQSKKAGVPFVFVDYGFGNTKDFMKKYSSFPMLFS